MKMTILVLAALAVGFAAGAVYMRGRCATCPKAAAKADGKDVYVMCRFDLKDGVTAPYLELTKGVQPLVRAENGCLGYTLLKDAETGMEKQQKFGEKTFWMVEHWASLEALKAHLEAPHMKAFGPKARPMRTASTFHVLTPACD